MMPFAVGGKNSALPQVMLWAISAWHCVSDHVCSYIRTCSYFIHMRVCDCVCVISMYECVLQGVS